MVSIFHDIHSVLEITGSQVHGVHRFCAYTFCPLQIFIVTYIVGNVLIPSRIQMNLALVLGTDGVFPLPCGYEITAGKTTGRHAGVF